MFFESATRHAIHPSESIGDYSRPEHRKQLIYNVNKNQPKSLSLPLNCCRYSQPTDATGFVHGQKNFTVETTDKSFRFETADGDRWRKTLALTPRTLGQMTTLHRFHFYWGREIATRTSVWNWFWSQSCVSPDLDGGDHQDRRQSRQQHSTRHEAQQKPSRKGARQ